MLTRIVTDSEETNTLLEEQVRDNQVIVDRLNEKIEKQNKLIIAQQAVIICYLKES